LRTRSFRIVVFCPAPIVAFPSKTGLSRLCISRAASSPGLRARGMTALPTRATATAAAGRTQPGACGGGGGGGLGADERPGSSEWRRASRHSTHIAFEVAKDTPRVLSTGGWESPGRAALLALSQRPLQSPHKALRYSKRPERSLLSFSPRRNPAPRLRGRRARQGGRQQRWRPNEPDGEPLGARMGPARGSRERKS